MVRVKSKLLDKLLAVTLAAIMLLTLIPMSTIIAFAESSVSGSDCQEASCAGKLQWVENSENEGMHHLVCDNEECPRNALTEAYLIHEPGEGDEDCLICNPPHVHGAFAYSVENDNTLVATCGSAGTCDLVDKKISIALVAPTGLEYDGTVKAAVISGDADWKAVTGNDIPTITYSAEPKNVGDYTASIVVDGATAFVEFTIVKGNPTYTVPENLIAKYGQTLADVVLPAGFAWDDQTASVGEIGTNTFKATFTPSDTENYNIVSNIDINVEVEKANSVIAAPSIFGEATQTTIVLEAITPTIGDGVVEYGYVADEAYKNDPSKVTNWQTNTTFNGLEGSKTYYFYARVKATTNYTAAVSMVSSISTADKLNGKLTISIDSWIYGDTAKDPDFGIVDGNYGSAKVEYATKGQTDWSEIVPTKAGQYTVKVYCDATAEYAEAVEYCDFEIKQKEVTITWSNTTLTYNADEQTPDVTIASGKVGSDNLDVVVSGAEKNVGTDYTATATLSGADKDNYVIKSNETQLFTITTKEIAITWTNTSLIHNKDQQKPTATINDGEIFAGDVVNVEVSGAMKQPGTYTATATLTGADANNYHIQDSLGSCTFGISNHSIPDDPYVIVKADADGKPTSEIANANENHWYNYNICIVPKENYEISIQDDEDKGFGEYLFVDSSKESYSFFLKCTDSNCDECKGKGGYTSALLVGDVAYGETFNNEVGNINIDKTNPTVSVKLNADNIWETFLNTISFGAYDRFFNTTQTVTITANDASDSNTAGNSGVEFVFYHISNVGKSLDTVKGLEDSAWIPGTVATFDSDNDYVVYTKIVDKAGNVTYASSDGFVYDDTKPVIDVSFDNNDVLNDKYFKANRTATIKITEHNFDATKVVLSVTENGTDTSSNYALNWSTNGDVHTATVLFENEADYTFAISSTDKAGNANEPVVYAGGSKATNEFTIDKSRPNASLVIEGLVKDAVESWKETWATADGDDLIAKVLTSINYNNRWSNGNAKVSATSTDNLSGIDYIEYFRTENVVPNITADNIVWSNSTKDSNTKDAFSFEVEPNEKFIVYVHIVDKAGNDIYLSSNGVIVDDKEPGGDNYSPEIDITLPEANKNGIYNEDDTVKVDFKVVEPKYKDVDKKDEAGIYSGIKEISYVIQAEDILVNNEPLKETDTFELNSTNCVVDANGLYSSWTGSITIDKDKFNSNNVVVMITAIDNAGNIHTSTTNVGDIKIDVTAPVIDIEYDNNAADSESFFKDNRTATIVVTERNFNSDDVKVVITNTDGVIPTVGEWIETEGTGNSDDTKWTTTITYNADGDYTFAIEYTDLADNVCESINYDEQTVAGTEFTVDKTLPVISVSYDNNKALNDKYFDASRTATVVVKEHNFDVNRVEFTQTAALNGTEITIPTASWVSNGDVHTATIVFDKDGDYTFDVKMIDKAGNECAPANYGESVAAKDFVVDQTIVKPIIGGIKNGGAYKENVVPTISFNDINYDSYEIKLVRTRKNEKNVDVTAEFIKGITEETQSISGVFDNFEKIVENDGIYTLTLKVIDKAGNEESEEYTFVVNRFGSVYEYNDKLADLIKEGGQYVKSVKDDIVITEYNADKLLAGSLKILITRDGEAIDVNYTCNPEVNDAVEVGESGWYQYVYTIKASNFAKDGVYKISLASEYATDDSEKNDSTSVPENSTMANGEAIKDTMTFTVDSVAPEIRNIVNLDEEIADVDKIVDGKLNVKYTIVDVGGLKSVEVLLNGKVIQTITAKELAEAAYNYTGSFDIDEQDGTTAQKIQIIVTDLAGNVTDTNSEEFLKAHSEDNEEATYVFFNEVTVSRNFFVRWYANTGLFWGSIAGVIVLAGAIVFFIAAKKKKNEETK